MFKKWILTFLLAFSLASGATFAADKINLNSASADELQMIDGIGPATAANIVEYRESNGEFASMADVVNVKGIGDAKAAQLAEQAIVGE
ncbi:MAG: helix-hairpin-helix domain-containing protein [Methylophaga sp.]